MPIIGMRDLARRTSDIVDEVERTRQPTIVTRHGNPVVAMIPIDAEAYEDFVLANAPEFLAAMKEADKNLAAGRTVAWDTVKHEFLPQKGSKRGGTKPRRTRSARAT